MNTIILSKGITVQVDGLPFVLDQDTFTTGVKENLPLLSNHFKSFGDPSVLKVAQLETSSTESPSSESMNPLK